MVGLGFLPGGSFSDAFAVSANNSVIVGVSDTGPGTNNQAFRWAPGGGMVSLGFLPGDNSSSASVVSADGSLVFGVSSISGSGIGGPFIWDATHGMRPLEQ